MDVSGLSALSPAALSVALEQGNALLRPLTDDLRTALLLALFQNIVNANPVVGPLGLHELLNAVTRAALEDRLGTPSEPESMH
jgi:hypothetical protein